MTSKHSVFYLGNKKLCLEDLCNLSFNKNKSYKLKLSSESKKLIKASNKYVMKICKSDKTIYGINTGFGALSDTHIPLEKLGELQVNLIRSHCTGVGDLLPPSIVRAMLILRVNCLIQGHSGISLSAIERLLDFYNFNIYPLVPSQGSVGASGDLAPLAHLALPLLGEGKVQYQGKIVTTKSVFKKLNLKPVSLGPKDGLALINGTTLMAAQGAKLFYEAQNLMKTADIACALSLDGLQGSIRAFDLRISKLKPHPGQLRVAKNLNLMLEESGILSSHKSCHKVQDAYSLRCVPQVHGACRQTISHLEEILEIEINSVTDNPIIFYEDDDIISGGNFHGEAIAMALDYLAFGLSELSNICERRIEKFMNSQFSELPPFLAKEPGLNSGLMIAQVTAASLVSENKTYAHPACVDSVPTSTDKEDHVSMGVNAGNKAFRILENLKYCLAIEFLCNTHAVDFHRPLKSSFCLEKVHSLIRGVVPPIDKDRNFSVDIKAIYDLIERKEIKNLIEKHIGDLQ